MIDLQALIASLGQADQATITLTIDGYQVTIQVAKQAKAKPVGQPVAPAPARLAAGPKKAIPLCQQPLDDADPLAVFVAKSGGINPDYAGGMRKGELAKIRELGKGLPPGAISRQASLTLEEMAEWCHAQGYTYRPDIDELLDALETDVNACAAGNKLGRVYKWEAPLSIQLAREQEHYDRLEA